MSIKGHQCCCCRTWIQAKAQEPGTTASPRTPWKLWQKRYVAQSQNHTVWLVQNPTNPTECCLVSHPDASSTWHVETLAQRPRHMRLVFEQFHWANCSGWPSQDPAKPVRRPNTHHIPSLVGSCPPKPQCWYAVLAGELQSLDKFFSV